MIKCNNIQEQARDLSVSSSSDGAMFCYYVIFGCVVALLTLIPLRDRYSEALR